MRINLKWLYITLASAFIALGAILVFWLSSDNWFYVSIYCAAMLLIWPCMLKSVRQFYGRVYLAVIPGLLLVLLYRLRYRLYRLLRKPMRSNNVIDYGADPYGILDSTSAIQDTLDTGYAHLPSGRFIASDVMRSNSVLVGEGMENTIIQMRTESEENEWRLSDE